MSGLMGIFKLYTDKKFDSGIFSISCCCYITPASAVAKSRAALFWSPSAFVLLGFL
jgi:hypothetical protein